MRSRVCYLSKDILPTFHLQLWTWNKAEPKFLNNRTRKYPQNLEKAQKSSPKPLFQKRSQLKSFPRNLNSLTSAKGSLPELTIPPTNLESPSRAQPEKANTVSPRLRSSLNSWLAFTSIKISTSTLIKNSETVKHLPMFLRHSLFRKK